MTPKAEHPEPTPTERYSGSKPHTPAERLVARVLGGVVIERTAR